MATNGFEAYTKGLQKSLASAAPQPLGVKPNKIIEGFNKRTQAAFDSMPDQINAQTAAAKAEELAQQGGIANQASSRGIGAEENSARAQNSIANTQEQVVAPRSVDNQTAPSDMGGLSAIAQIGKAETNAQNAKFASRPRPNQGALMGPDGMAFEGGGNIPGLDGEQAQNANAIANEGRRRGMSDGDIQTAIMTSLAESGLKNLNWGDRDSVGLFQQRTSQGWGSVEQIMNPSYSAGKFFEGLSRVNRNQTPWMQAQSVQRSAFADGSNYRAQFDRAKSITTAIVSAPVMKYNGSAEWISSHTNWYGDYDGKYNMQCVDLYNFYTSGFVGGRHMGGVVGAVDIWNKYDSNAYVQINRTARPQMGDVAIFGRGGGFDALYGHVAIVAQPNTNGTIRVLNANATSAGPTARTTMSNFSTSNIVGYLRPRKLLGA